MSESVSRSFSGSIPKVYDEILGPVYFEPYAEETAKQVARLSPRAVLEIACGTGRVTNHLHRHLLPDCSLVATDINPDMIAVAKEKLAVVDGILWMQADGADIPFDAGSFDVVVCQFGIMFFPDKLKGLKEACRLVKSTGTYLFNVWDKLSANPFAAVGREILLDFFDQNPPEYFRVPFSFNDPDRIVEMVAEAGFKKIRYETLLKPLIAPSAERMADGLLEGSPVIHAIREKDPAAIPVLKNKILETLIGRFGNNPCRSEMQAIQFTAKKE